MVLELEVGKLHAPDCGEVGLELERREEMIRGVWMVKNQRRGWKRLEVR